MTFRAKSILKLSSLFLCAIVFFACNKETAIQQKQGESITVAQFGHLLIYFPIYLAQQKGFYEKNGIHVNFVSTGGDDKTFAAVSSGAALFGVADPAFVAIAREKGLKSKIIGTLVDGAPMWIVSKDKINIKDKDSLLNKKIMTYPAPSTSYTLLGEILRELHPRTKGASIVQGAFGTELAVLQSGQADAIYTIEPIVSTAAEQGYYVIYSAMDSFGPMSFTGISVLESNLASKDETIRHFMRSVQQAIDYLYANFDEAVELASKEFPETNKSIIRTALKRMLDEKVIPPSLETNEASLNNALGIRIKVGDLKVAPPFNEVVTNQFLSIKQ